MPPQDSSADAEPGEAVESARWVGELRQLVRRRSGRSFVERIAGIGVLGAVVLCSVATAYLSFRYPPFRVDESSHVGYVLEVRNGRLPSLDTPVPAADGGELLEAAIARPWPWSVPEIHVAINPPYAYVGAVTPATITEALDVRAGPLLGVRLFNAGCTGLAVYVTYRLCRELTGSVDVSLFGATLLATLLGVVQLGALAYLEGPALLATTGVAWWLARFVRTRRLVDATGFGLWCALAAGVRTMSTVYAVGAVAIALVVGLRGSPRHRFWPLLGRVGVPGLVAVGWFYALNLHRYGEPTGSDAVYGERFSDRGFVSWLLSRDSLAAPLDYLLLEVSGERGWWLVDPTRQFLVLAAVVTVFIVAVTSVIRRRRSIVVADDDSTGQIPVGASPASWVAVLVLSAVPVLLISYHMSKGGAGNPRYVAPLLPVVAAAVALVVSRVGRWAMVALAAASTAALAMRLDDAARVHDEAMFKKLAGPLVGSTGRHLVLAIAVVSAVVVLGSLAALAARMGGGGAPSPDGGDLTQAT